MSSASIEHRRAQSPLLPDFCSIATLFPLVVIGELLAFVLVLKPGGAAADVIRDLALTSLFVQWVVLSSSGVLCALKGRLNALAPAPAASIALLVILIVVGVLSEAAFWSIIGGAVPLSLAPNTRIDDSVLWLVQQDTLGLSLAAATHVDFLLRNVAIGAIVGAVALRYTYVQQQWKLRVELEAQARVAALQARIRPHFLFNSMNTIASFTRTQPALAEQVVEDLADLFRATLSAPEASATLSSELQLARQYLSIEQLRLGERLRLHWSEDASCAAAHLPSFCLQPLVENAVYHGIEMLPDGGDLDVSTSKLNDRVVIQISNEVSVQARPRSGNQLAQANVSERIAAFFDGNATFEIDARPGRYAVRLEFPLVTASLAASGDGPVDR